MVRSSSFGPRLAFWLKSIGAGFALGLACVSMAIFLIVLEGLVNPQ